VTATLPRRGNRELARSEPLIIAGRSRRAEMMRRLLAAPVLWVWLAWPAAGMDAASINNAEYQSAKPSAAGKVDALIIKVQVLLDRARFSPGEIDGKLGENAQKALKAFTEARGLKPNQPLTPEVWKALAETSSDAVVIEYKISNDDIKGPFLERLPARMEDMKHLKSLSYTSPREAIAEKFHMSEGLLEALNPRKKFDQAGEIIVVANVLGNDAKLKADRIEVDKSRQTVKAFASSGELVAFFPATVGSKEKPTPGGTLKVVSVDANPNYRYNPDYKFKGVRSKQAFEIKPGPNNPVGSFWIGLSAEGYGIHGTSSPTTVSKSQSHGCVRLTNWDAGLLGRNIKKGTPVTFVEQAPTSGKS
jgi:lipoprotein-anchoring transpeptidase ErfK/SrfK